MTSTTYRCLAIKALIFLIGALFFISAQGAEQQFTLKIYQRQIEKKPPTLKVRQGDKLVLNWTSDEVVKLHLHGYDLLLTLKPASTSVTQSPQKMTFTAHIAGRFPLSAHGFGAHAKVTAKNHHEVPLLYLEVEPQ